jgi:hypothetical protein
MNSNKVDKVTFDDANMFARINGRRYRIPMQAISLRLARATKEQREMVRVSPSGFVITWPQISLEAQITSLVQLGQPYWGGI